MKRKVETPTTVETPESQALFQGDPELMTDDHHIHSASPSSATDSKHMPKNNETDWMVMLKGLMAQQTAELKSAVGIEVVKRTMVSSEKKAEERFVKIEARLDTADASAKNQITKLEERLTALELGGTENEDGARGQPAAHAVAMAGWKPCHIMGVGGPKTPRESCISEATKWNEEFGGNAEELILAPYTPKKYSGNVGDGALAGARRRRARARQ